MMHLSNRRGLVGAALAALLLVPTFPVSPPSGAAPSRAELERAEDRLRELERDFELIVERYNLVNERLDSLKAQLVETQVEVDGIRRRMLVKRDQAIEIATELYKGGTAQAIEAVLSSQSLNDVDRGIVYLERSEHAQSEVFQSLQVQEDLLDRKLEDLEEAKDRAAREQARLDELRVQVESKIAEQQDEIAELNALIEQADRRRARREAERRRAAQRTAPTPVTISPAAPPNERAGIAVESALSQVGKPYQWGASGPNSYDCSGLTMWAWAQAGVSLPHNSGAQYAATAHVSREDLAPGDLMFFGSPIHHVGMYIGNGQMVEAPYTGAYVRVVAADRSDYVGAGRPGV